MRKNISIVDDFITSNEINLLLNFYKENNNYTFKHGSTYPLSIDSYFFELRNKINMFFKPIDICIDWWQVVHWPINSFQDLHYDNTDKKTTLSSILYLNNNFNGGETYFEEGTIISPKLNRCLIFDGKKYKHGVNKINKGDRYTLAIWYKNNI